MSVSPELTPRERSEAVRRMYDDFTSTEIADQVYALAGNINHTYERNMRAKMRHHLNMLLSVAHKKGFNDAELVSMQEQQFPEFTWDVIKTRRVVNFSDLKWRRKLAGRR